MSIAPAVDGRDGVAHADPVVARRSGPKRHLPLLLVVLGAVTLRVLFLVAYDFPFFFSDSKAYVSGAEATMPGVDRPYGYSFFLKPFVPGGLTAVVIVQHLLVVGLVVLGYVFLTRRGVRPWLAALAVLPIALDAREVTLEHYILAETLFLALAMAALVVVAWQEKPGLWAALAGGALLSAAVLTRSVGLPLAALVVVYLLVRRAKWYSVVAFVAVVGLSIAGYSSWYQAKHNVFATGQFQGRFLYARTMSLADCGDVDLADWERPLCVKLPADVAQMPDSYIWNPDSPANKLYPSTADDPKLQQFAIDVLKQQPGNFLATVARETGWHLVQPELKPQAACLAAFWLPPERPDAECQAYYYRATPTVNDSPVRAPEQATSMTSALADYGRVVTTPGLFYPVAILLALVAAAWRPRRAGWRDAADALLFVAGGFGLIVFSVATSMYDTRYVLPAVLLVPIGAAFAVQRILEVRRPATATPSVSSEEPPASAESDR